MLDDGVHGGLEAHVHGAVGLVKDQDAQVVDVDAGSLVEVLEDPTGGADEDVHAGETIGLLLETLAADDEAGGEEVAAADLAQDLEDLNGELTGRRNDQGAEAIVLGKLVAVEALEDGDEEGQGLAAAGFGGGEDIAPLERKGYGARLDVGQGFEVRGLEAGEGLVGDGQFGELVRLGLEVLQVGKE